MPQVVFRGAQSAWSLVDAELSTGSENLNSTFFIIPCRSRGELSADYLMHMYDTLRCIELHASLPVPRRRWRVQVVALPIRLTLPNLALNTIPSVLVAQDKAHIEGKPCRIHVSRQVSERERICGDPGRGYGYSSPTTTLSVASATRSAGRVSVALQ